MSRKGLLLAAALLVGCSRPSPVDDEAAMMQAGLDALYQRHDAAAAEAKFRKVLEKNPTHYGATFQLAAALDATGRREEARPLWDRMLSMAEHHQDEATATEARKRLAADGGPLPPEQMMQAALDARYQRHDLGAAIAELRRMLVKNPDHYGANYQLASALEAAGRRDEARPVWENVLRMAEATGDRQTADAARAALGPTS